jgi:chemotaxis regulatin CheY-phosphate phosphatase CheZ
MKKNKVFDCVEMKRSIQEKIYEETKSMDHEQFQAYFHRRITNSRFAPFLNQPSEIEQKIDQ